MKALVTGASGALGSNLAKALVERGDTVISIEHDLRPIDCARALGIKDQITWCLGDIVNETFVKRVIADYEIDVVYHLAALPIIRTGVRTTRPIFEVNTMGTLSILEALKEQTASGNPVGMVYVSTDKVYGEVDWGRKYLETDLLNAKYTYEVSKVCAERICSSFYENRFIERLAILRPCNQYGPGDFNSRLIPNTIKRCLQGKNPIIYRDIPYVREYNFFTDFASGAMAVGDNLDKPDVGSGQAFNIGSGETRNQETVIKEILVHFPKLEPEYQPPPKYHHIEIPYQALDHSKLTRTLGWEPKVKFPDGLARTVAWWELHPELWNVRRDTNVLGSPDK